MKLFIINGENNNEKIEIQINEYLMVTDIKHKIDEILTLNGNGRKYYFRLIHKNIILLQNKSIKYYKICENDEIWFGYLESYLKYDDVIVEVYHLGEVVFGGDYLIVKSNETISTITSIIERLNSEIINVWNSNGIQMKNDQTLNEIDTNGNYKLIIKCDDGKGNKIYSTFDECCCFLDKYWVDHYFFNNELPDDNKDESIRTILIDVINNIKNIFPSTNSDDDRLNDNLSDYPSSFLNSKNLFSEDMTYSIVDIFNDYRLLDMFEDEDVERIYSKYIQFSLRSALWNYCNLRQCNKDKTNKSVNDIIIDAFYIFLKYLNDSYNDWQYWFKLLSNQYLIRSLSEYEDVEMMDDSSIIYFTFEIKIYGEKRYITLEGKPKTVNEAKIIISNLHNVEMKHLYCIKPGGDHKPNDEDPFDTGFIIEVVLGMNDIEILKSLGQGGFGEAFLCLDKSSNREFVLKRGFKNKYLSRDINMYSKLNSSSFIMSYSGLFRDEEGLGIAMQYMSGGSLCGYLYNVKHLSEHEIIRFSLQILRQINELHESGIIHRDIKSENIVLDDQGNAKLIDFGLSKFSDGFTSKEMMERLKVYLPGTIYYMAPELIKEEPYSNKIDIWSFGMVMVEMVTLKRPFPGLNMYKVSDELLKLREYMFTPIVSISNEFQQFIKWCLMKNSEERPSTKQLIDSEFCNNHMNLLNK